ncbi:MAG: hypothetical protein SOY12_09660, partial [Schaedlerella sp.]|nr:hypothetical protein [Schaedlerella sp.]
GLFLHQPFKGPVLAGSKVHSVASFLNLGTRKAAFAFPKVGLVNAAYAVQYKIFNFVQSVTF